MSVARRREPGAVGRRAPRPPFVVRGPLEGSPMRVIEHAVADASVRPYWLPWRAPSVETSTYGTAHRAETGIVPRTDVTSSRESSLSNLRAGRRRCSRSRRPGRNVPPDLPTFALRLERRRPSRHLPPTLRFDCRRRDGPGRPVTPDASRNRQRRRSSGGRTGVGPARDERVRVRKAMRRQGATCG